MTTGLYIPHFRDYLSRSLDYRQQNETPCKKTTRSIGSGQSSGFLLKQYKMAVVMDEAIYLFTFIPLNSN